MTTISFSAREVPIVETVRAVSDTTAEIVRVAFVVYPFVLSSIRILSAVVSPAVWSTSSAVPDHTAVVTRAVMKAFRGARVTVHLILLSSGSIMIAVICTPKYRCTHGASAGFISTVKVFGVSVTVKQ